MFPVKRFLSYFFLRQQGEEFFLAFLALTLFVAGWGFLGVMQDVLAKDPLVLADQAVYNFFQSLRNSWSDRIFVAITELGDSFVNICLSGAVLLVLLGKRCYRAAGYWAVTALVGLAGVQLLKWLIHSPRPIALYHGASAYGFPSGHTTMSVVLYGFLAILLARGLSGTLRWGLFVSVFLISFIIAISRLYLGAHWLSDVLGGFFIGASWVALLGIAYLKNPDQGLPRRLLGLATVLVIVVAGAWHVSRHHEKDLAFYAPRHNLQAMPLVTWLADGWRDLPAWRIDMAGEREQPLTIQWAGAPEELAQYLLNRGWQTPQSFNLKSFLEMLSPDTPIEKLPVLPRLHDGRIDRLRLVRKAGSQLWVLRMWPTDVKILANEARLLVGTIEVQNKRSMAGLIFTARDTGEYDRSLGAFEQEFRNRFAMKLVDRKDSEFQVSRDQDRVDWSGRVLLLWQI
jgi:undecaprenyl-diphosphatase